MERFDFYLVFNPNHDPQADRFEDMAQAKACWDNTIDFDKHGNPFNPAMVMHITDDVTPRIISDDWLDAKWDDVEEQRRIDEAPYVDPHKEHRLTASQLGVGRYA